MKFTKQGIRDLNTIKAAKPAGIRLAEFPEAEKCSHPEKQRIRTYNGTVICKGCNATLFYPRFSNMEG